MRHILVPFDFSETARHALEVAVDLARDLKARVTLLYVPHTEKVTEGLMGIDAVQYLSRVLDEDDPSAPTPVFRHEELEQAAREKLEASVDPTWRKDIAIGIAVEDGRPPQTIVKYAADNGVDLIVMGTHGRGPVAHFFVGSVAENVVRTAGCPVMTVRSKKAR